MYRDDIRDLKIQKVEANLMILYDFLTIYLKLKIWFPNLVAERDSLVRIVQMYFDCDQNESEVLKKINACYGTIDDHEGVDELLEEFDTRFENIFNYCQDTFVDYEEVFLEYGTFLDLLTLRINCSKENKPYEPAQDIRYRMHPRPINFPLFDKEYKKKLLVLIPNLKEPERWEE